MVVIPEDIVETNNWYRSHLMPVIEHAGSRGCKHVYSVRLPSLYCLLVLLASSSITIVVVNINIHSVTTLPSLVLANTTVNKRYLSITSKVVIISHCTVCSVTICFSTSSQLEENVTVQVAGKTFNFYFN